NVGLESSGPAPDGAAALSRSGGASGTGADPGDAGADVGEVVVVVAPGSVPGGGGAWAGGIPVTSIAWGLPRPGVGSRATHPAPGSQTSGQAWALRPLTWYSRGLSGSTSPQVNPTATRAGMPMARANAAKVPANCWQ